MSAASDIFDQAAKQQAAKYGDPSQALDKRNATNLTPTADVLNKRNATQGSPADITGVYETLSAHADKVHPVKP